MIKELIFRLALINGIFLLGYFTNDLYLLIPLNIGIIFGFLKRINED